MKEVRILVTTQIRLFPPDTVPVPKLVLGQHREAIRSLFDFQNVEPVVRRDAVAGLTFNTGTYKPDSVVIESVSIEERRIVVKAHGKTEIASAVYRAVQARLEELSDGRKMQEILCTHETESSVVLDIPFERLFSDSFLSFLHKSAAKYTRNEWSQNLILPSNLKFTVRYKVTDDNLVKSHITLAPKDLTIEPRVQSSPEDRLYWITSPTDTETHFKLIDDLEQALVRR